MVIYSKLGDTPNSIAHDYLGFSDADYAKQIRERNHAALGWRLMNNSGIYADNWPLWLPDKKEDVDTHISQAIVQRLEWGKSYQRASLANAQRAGVNIHDILGLHHLLQRANALAQQTRLTDKLTDFGLLATGNTFDLVGKRYEVFDKHIKGFNQDVADYIDADEAAKPQMLKTIEQQRETISRLFSTELKRFKLLNSRSLFNNKLTAANDEALHAWDVHSPFVSYDIDTMTDSIGHIGKGFVMLDFGLGVYKTIEDFRRGDPSWAKEMGKTATKFVFNYFTAQFAEAVFTILIEVTPVGWIGTIIFAAAMAGSMMGFDHVIDKYTFTG